jgi:hypothetical protein
MLRIFAQRIFGLIMTLASVMLILGYPPHLHGLGKILGNT